MNGGVNIPPRGRRSWPLGTKLTPRGKLHPWVPGSPLEDKVHPWVPSSPLGAKFTLKGKLHPWGQPHVVINWTRNSRKDRVLRHATFNFRQCVNAALRDLQLVILFLKHSPFTLARLDFENLVLPSGDDTIRPLCWWTQLDPNKTKSDWMLYFLCAHRSNASADYNAWSNYLDRRNSKMSTTTSLSAWNAGNTLMVAFPQKVNYKNN
jgi:hypothetical protein